MAKEATQRFVGYDEWFIEEVEKGLAQVERGQVLTHEEVGARLEQLLAEKRPRSVTAVRTPYHAARAS